MDGGGFTLHALRERRRHGGEAFTIIAIETGQPVGQIRLFNWSSSEREAEIGYWLRRKYWGRGLGTEAVRLGCRFAFARMRLHRLSATVVVGNLRSERVLRNAGFRVEGTRRSAAHVGRGWGDERIFGLLRSD
jgi:ribosomal-protein-alanine N-acetyltransferase